MCWRLFSCSEWIFPICLLISVFVCPANRCLLKDCSSHISDSHIKKQNKKVTIVLANNIFAPDMKICPCRLLYMLKTWDSNSELSGHELSGIRTCAFRPSKRGFVCAVFESESGVFLFQPISSLFGEYLCDCFHLYLLVLYWMFPPELVHFFIVTFYYW